MRKCTDSTLAKNPFVVTFTRLPEKTTMSQPYALLNSGFGSGRFLGWTWRINITVCVKFWEGFLNAQDFKFPFSFGQIEVVFGKCSMATSWLSSLRKAFSTTSVPLVLSTPRPLLTCSKCSHLLPVSDGNAGSQGWLVIFFFFFLQLSRNLHLAQPQFLFPENIFHIHWQISWHC